MFEDVAGKIDHLADLVRENRLSQAEWAGEGFRIVMRKRSATRATAHTLVETHDEGDVDPVAEPSPPANLGFAVTSPMAGIYYASPSPSAPAFVSEGDSVTVGQVVGLIEAMKVFNEITAMTSGKVTKLVAQTGKIVQPGEPLLFIG